MSLVAIGCGALWCAAIVGVEPNESFRYTTPRTGDEVRVSQAEGATIFAVHSRNGIGEATLERRAERWPERIVLRLHLRGLENFVATAGEKKVGLSVSSNGQIPRVRQWLGDGERDSLDARSPLWIELREIDADGRPSEAVPLRGGYFELRLPAALTAENPHTLQLHWIDFYR